MPKCFKCFLHFANVSAYKAHLKTRHQLLLHWTESLKCIDGNCVDVSFSNFSNYHRHYKNLHSNLEEIASVNSTTGNFPSTRSQVVGTSEVTENENSFSPQACSSMLIDEPHNRNDLNGNSSHNIFNSFGDEDCSEGDKGRNLDELWKDFSSYPSEIEILKNELHCFVSAMYSNPKITRKHIQVTLEHVQSITNVISSLLRPLFLKMKVNSTDSVDTADILEQILKLLDNPFQGVETEYKRLKTYKEAGTYISPEPHELGEYKVPSPSSGTIQTRTLTAQHIPLRSLLKTFLEVPGIFPKVMEWRDNLKKISHSMVDVTHGETWKKNFSSSDKLMLPVSIYADDFECGNVLGSHSGIHKITGYYCGLLFLPPEFSSKLNCIFTVYLHHSSDRHAVDSQTLYAPLVKEFEFLLKTGVHLKTETYEGPVHFPLALLQGDNLGLHQMLGLIEGFTGNHPCRYCNVYRPDMQILCSENKSLLRDKENHLQHLDFLKKNPNLDCASLTGIREPCAWNEVPNVDFLENTGVDLLHDVFEGVCKYDMRLIINYYIRNQTFSLPLLNNRLEFYDYGPIDKSNKPPLLTFDKKDVIRLKMSGSEMAHFMKYFGLLAADLVPEGDPV